MRTEAGSSVLLLLAALVAIGWVAIDPRSYQALWRTPLGVRLGPFGLGQDLRGWVNNGLMTFFFLVIGLEARRAFDVGDLRERRRVLLPVLAGVGGMLASVGIYLVLNGGGPAARGWGIALSTDTAFALALLSVARARPLQPLRAFLVTVVVVDDLLSLLVIAAVYSGPVSIGPLAAGVGVFAVIMVGVWLRVQAGVWYLIAGVVTWACLFISGLDPLIVGLGMGLLSYALPVEPDALEGATTRMRSFREQPTSELAREARRGLSLAVTPNERLQQLFHPWSSYVIVPLFALANAGIPITGQHLDRALHSSIAIGITLGYVLGKPVGILVASWLTRTLSRRRLEPPVGWAAVLGGGTSAGVGFTVALLIATLAFDGPEQTDAKIAILASAAISAVVTVLVFRGVAALPSRLRARAVFGNLPPLTDLTEPVDPEHDHIRGDPDAPVTLLEYGDLQCPYCGQAEPAIRQVLASNTDIRYVWRHLPLRDVHPNAALAAEATEAAASQGRFWPMHDRLLAHQDHLEPKNLIGHADALGLDVERFRADLRQHTSRARIVADVESAAESGVRGTPTFFINGRRHHGVYDLDALLAGIREARARE
ncbi:MAG: Na+/H+ antiporter NhaA [Humibacillus sp.]|nr:Na+/H+ antiporter NhaA [Humibacillus sp.]